MGLLPVERQLEGISHEVGPASGLLEDFHMPALLSCGCACKLTSATTTTIVVEYCWDCRDDDCYSECPEL